MKQRKTVEDYLKAVYLLQKQNGSVRGADIAAELHVSRPTVSVSLKELERRLSFLRRCAGSASDR